MQKQKNHYSNECSDIDALLQAIAAADMDALAQLYRLTSASVYAYALSILKSREDAEDVLHDCYVRIFTYTGNYRSQGKPMAWILTIARNLCMNKLQQRRQEPQVYVQDWMQYITSSPGIHAEEKLLLSACLEALPEEERQIVILHCVGLMSYREISQFLKLPISTVISKYHRSIKKIRKYVGEEV